MQHPLVHVVFYIVEASIVTTNEQVYRFFKLNNHVNSWLVKLRIEIIKIVNERRNAWFGWVTIFSSGEKILLHGIKVGVFFGKNIEKKHLYRHDKNYYYFCNSNITVINLIVGSRNMIKVLKNTTL